MFIQKTQLHIYKCVKRDQNNKKGTEEEVRRHKLRLFPGNLISINNKQLKIFVKCPSNSFSLKNVSINEEKQMRLISVRPTYN